MPKSFVRMRVFGTRHSYKNTGKWRQNINQKREVGKIIICKLLSISTNGKIQLRFFYLLYGTLEEQKYSTYNDFISNEHRRFLSAHESFINAFYFMNLGPIFKQKTAYQLLQEESNRIKSKVNGADYYRQVYNEEFRKSCQRNRLPCGN